MNGRRILCASLPVILYESDAVQMIELVKSIGISYFRIYTTEEVRCSVRSGNFRNICILSVKYSMICQRAGL